MRGARVTAATRRFGTQAVLEHVDLDIAPGEFVALVGRSGSGKTTLLRMLAGLDQPDTGTVEVPGRRAVVFQEPRLLPWRRVWRNAAIGLEGDARSRALAALEEVGLGHRTEAWPLTLSGGEAQRVGLARALVREPSLLLLDEPLGALDALTRLNMQRLLERLWRRHGCAVLLVTHDVDEALLLADRVVLLEAGRISRSWTVGLPRPRRVGAAGLAPLREGLLAGLGVEAEAGEQDAVPPPARTRHASSTPAV